LKQNGFKLFKYQVVRNQGSQRGARARGDRDLEVFSCRVQSVRAGSAKSVIHHDRVSFCQLVTTADRHRLCAVL